MNGYLLHRKGRQVAGTCWPPLVEYKPVCMLPTAWRGVPLRCLSSGAQGSAAGCAPRTGSVTGYWTNPKKHLTYLFWSNHLYSPFTFKERREQTPITILLIFLSVPPLIWYECEGDWNVTSSRESQSCTRLPLAQVPLALWVSTQVPFLPTFSREQPEAAWFLCCKFKIIKHRTSSLWILRAGWSLCKLCSFPLWVEKKSEEMHLIWAKKKELLSTCYRVGSQSTRKQVRQQQDQGVMELHQAEVAPEAKQGYCSIGKFSLVSREAGRQLSIPRPLAFFAQRKQLNLQLIS